MNYDGLYNKILGSLATSCIGDALGCPTEQLTMDEIRERFGGFVTDFHPTFPGHPFYHPNRRPGQITDDASVLLKMAEAVVESKGKLTLANVATHLLLWSEEPEFQCAGPTTVAAVEALRDGGDPAQTGKTGKLTTDGVSNGAAMKVSPAGLANPGDMEGAVADAITICLPTHGTSLAMEGACAIACGVAEALQDGATVASVVRAALLGAELGKEQCREMVRVLPGPSIRKRIELAVSLAMCSANLEQAMVEIEAYIGNGLPISETVPAAVGLFVAADGDPLRTVYAASNIGNDTDTIATIAGALAGALKGFDNVPQDLYEQVACVNDLDLDKMAADLVEVVKLKRKG